MTLNQLFLPIQKTLNICPAVWPIIAAIAGSRRTNEVPLPFPVDPANQSPTGQARAVHQFFRGHGPVFADRACLFQNLKNLQNNPPLIEQGSGISRYLRKYMIASLRTARFFVKCRQAMSAPLDLPVPLPGRHTREAVFSCLNKFEGIVLAQTIRG